jgi:hypothetical protein
MFTSYPVVEMYSFLFSIRSRSFILNGHVVLTEEGNLWGGKIVEIIWTYMIGLRYMQDEEVHNVYS